MGKLRPWRLGSQSRGSQLGAPDTDTLEDRVFSFFKERREKRDRNSEDEPLLLTFPGSRVCPPRSAQPPPSSNSRQDRCLLHQLQLEQEGDKAAASSPASSPPMGLTPEAPESSLQVTTPGAPSSPPRPTLSHPPDQPPPSGSPPVLHSPAGPHPRPGAERRPQAIPLL
ncbi:unnamed protein product [Rangifer tarandus platyrhynchus]|uniref:Uncharacterized protein n=1 Tax=Rangifer tarandus platyrhynchus TaxID=3082113 RepID=A0AC59ZJ85_RANTA